MAHPVPLTRRALLRAAALTGGGLVLSVRLPARAEDADPATTPSDEPAPEPRHFAPNAWVRIHADGRIVLAVARSEMGQGVTTALPMLLAEEMEVPMDRVRIEMAPADPAYANRMLGRQATGGSTSVRDAWLPLREAGAAARDMLVAAAARAWGVPESACSARRARVHHPDGKTSLGYGELAPLAAALPVPDLVLLKDPDEWTLIGTPEPRLDTPAKVAGRAVFGRDVRLPDMVFASIERCPVLGGRLRRFDDSAARARPGVVEVMRIGQGVAVIAGDTWSALAARRALSVEWSAGRHKDYSSERIRGRFRWALAQRGALARAEGDLRGALSEAARVLEADYEVPFQAHACMEPMCCTAHVTDTRCEIHVPTQNQSGVLEMARRLTRLPAARIVVRTTYLGGGFGRRGEQDFVAEAVELALKLRRPVHVVWTREDDLRHDFYRPMTFNRLRGGLDSEGLPVAWFHRIVGPSILARVRPAGIRDGIDPTSVAGAADLPYPIPNLRVEYRRADTPVPVGFWRSVGASQNAYVTECFLDELARAGGQDPVALRRRLLRDQPRLLGVLDLAADKAKWGTPLPEGRARGVAVCASFGSFVAQVAEVSVAGDRVRVHRVVCAVDCGVAINPDTVRAQMQSGIVYGLTAALKGAIEIEGGRVVQGNFDDYPLLRASETPLIDVHVVQSEAEPGGVGEPGTPPIAPALANAVFAATGVPVRSLPIRLPATPAADTRSENVPTGNGSE